MADIKKAMTVFRDRGYDVSCFDTKEDAVEYLKGVIKDTSVAFGGSVTLKEIKLYEALSGNNIVIWHGMMKNPRVYELERKCRVYVTSANAVTETGEIINIDGSGNRISSTLYGHEKVYFIVGVNKLTEDLESGIYRAKNVAAPLNCKRLNKKTPCAVKADRCYNCDSPERICRATLIMERNLSGAKCEIVFINESLGY